MSETILTREDAQALVAKIRNDNGGVSPEDEAGMKKYYPAAWEALRSVRRKLGSATKTLATNLYSKDTRFLYELIQNADDNQYTRARANSDDPFLSFSLYPDRLVIDSNEDGFTTENVKAICSIGQSTKTVAQGYIGEKGIGFKSVFKIAQRVHVQSGPFSFSFNNTPGSDDDGLGMVTPSTEPYDDLPEFIGTRMTLELLNSLDFCERAEELSNIPDTLLLFLRKLRSIQVNIYPTTGDAMEIQYSCHRDLTPGVETAEKHSRSNGGQSIVKKRNFRVARRTIKDLPYDAARKHMNQADVVLAFPVNETNDRVVLQKQHVFAYLPLRQVGFNFLIQSDFITQASREDVFHSHRNQALLRGVAETFRDAVLGFCEHDTLQYQWMRYLPDDSISDEFWKQLKMEIEDLLKRTPVLKSWSGRLCRPDQLRFVTTDRRDQYGEPLFSDLSEEIYLGPRYKYRDFRLLTGLGTEKVCKSDTLDRIEADLRRPDSKMKTIASEDDWHSRVADFLLKYHLEKTPEMKTLPLIPLADGSWVPAGSINPFSPIYFPVSGSSEIPTGLRYRLVDPDAVKNKSRKILFKHLGVIDCDPQKVIQDIYTKHSARSGMANHSDTVSHLRFLFFNLPADASLHRNFWMYTEKRDLVNPKCQRAYFPDSSDTYDAKSVFQPRDPNLSYFPATFIHPDYLKAVPNASRSHGMSFSVWLEQVMSVKRIPQIHQSWNGRPSQELDYILEHRSKLLLGLLRKNWPHYASVMTVLIEQRLKKSEVPSEAGAMVQLQGSYMPLPRLIKIAESCGVLKASFFVRAPSSLRDEDGESWEFLSRFGVRFVDDVDFYMELLDSIESSSEDEENYSSEAEEAIFRVYNGIMRKCITEEDYSNVRSFLEQDFRVYLPSSRLDDVAGWYKFTDCVWDGPNWLTARLRLSVVTEYQDLRHLLKNILELHDANWNDSLAELSSMRENSEMDHSKASQIYRSLWRDFEKDSNHEVLRSKFEEDSLIFDPCQNAWFPPSSCLWADNRTRIPERVPISTPYASLREFFCQMLQVQKPDLQMHIQALKQLAKEKPPSTPQIKESIGLISAMDPSANDLKTLRTANIFPVRLPSGDVKLTNSTVDFAIVDRKEYEEAFKDRLFTLDFSFNELHTCRPFLLALDLGRRFMSVAVEEKTMVEGGFVDRSLTEKLREKAHALLRISTQFNSPKTREGEQTVFDLFRRATVHVSERISKSISLTQSLQTFTVERSRANVHLEDCDGQLQLYVPSDKRNRELCYLQQLPRRIMQFLSISNVSAEALLVQVLGSSSLDIVDAILEDAGIIELEHPISNGVDHSPQPSEVEIPLTSSTSHDVAFDLTEDRGDLRAEDHHEQIRQNDGNLLQNGHHSPFPHGPSDRTVPAQPESIGRSAFNLGHANTDVSGNGNVSSTAGFELRPTQSVPSAGNGVESDEAFGEDAEYAELLNRVISAASIAEFPDREEVAKEPQSTSTTIFGVRSMNRDRKVGAAGELYAFEILRDLELPSFDTSNWRSTIRKEVRVCDKYRDLEPWNGSETSDIVYTDRTSVFTRFLVEEGYLSSETSISARPTYYLEVKTTTGQCNEPFYMSGSQYKRMKRMALEDDSDNSEIYVLLRVYNIENGGIGMKVYLDPFKAKEEKELTFTVNTWAVRPMMEVQT